MNPTSLTFMVLFSCVLTCSAQSVQHAILAPDQAADIAHDGQYLWMPSGTDLYRINVQTGDEEQQYGFPFHSLFGATFDGSYLWLSERNYGKIMKLDTATGAVLDEYFVSASNPSGMTWDGTHLWLLTNEANQIQDSLYQIDPQTGQVLSKFELLLDEPFGLGFDGTHLWAGENSAGEIHELDPSNIFSQSSYPAPGGNFPNGLAHDGLFMWVSNAATDTIYQFTLGPSGIDDQKQVGFVVFPNPSKGLFQVEPSNLLSPFSLVVYDTNGRPMKTIRNGNSIDLSNLPRGMYVLEMIQDDSIKRKRISVTG